MRILGCVDVCWLVGLGWLRLGGNSLATPLALALYEVCSSRKRLEPGALKALLKGSCTGNQSPASPSSHFFLPLYPLVVHTLAKVAGK